LLGWLAERGWDRALGWTLAAMALGHAVILACGVFWLASLVGWERAVAVGLTPFWTATILKTVLGAAVLPLAWRFSRTM
jgi:biotin transport system substrate-specific component